MSDFDPMEVAAIRRLLHRGAEAAVGEDAEDLTPVEKADVVLERLESVEETVHEVAERTYLLTTLSNDGATKRARKVQVMEHLIEKAEQTRSGKSHIEADTAAAVAECSDRQARTYLDELAGEIPGCFLREADEIGEAKQLRINLETFRAATPHAEAFPPREMI